MPASQEKEEPMKSIPPQVKVISAWQALIGVVAGHAMDGVAMWLLYLGVEHHNLEPMYGYGAILAIAAGSIGSFRFRGMATGASGAVIAGVAGAAAGGGGPSAMAKLAALFSASILISCAGVSEVTEEAHTALDEVTVAVQPVVDKFEEACVEVGELVGELCKLHEDPATCYADATGGLDAACEPAIEVYETLVDAQEKAREALDTVNACAEGDAACLGDVVSAVQEVIP